MLSKGSLVPQKSSQVPIGIELFAIQLVLQLNNNSLQLGVALGRLLARRKRSSIRTVIKNYGLMWRRDAVFWGKGNRKGVLEGRRSGKTINFRDQIGVYVLYDESRRPVYVGQAGQGN